jgi:hypothetical protein
MHKHNLDFQLHGRFRDSNRTIVVWVNPISETLIFLLASEGTSWMITRYRSRLSNVNAVSIDVTFFACNADQMSPFSERGYMGMKSCTLDFNG